MWYAVKANRQYKITEEEKPKYLAQGYKIAKLEKGKLVFEEEETAETKAIIKLENENKKLKEEIKKLEKELEGLKKIEEPNKAKGEDK